MGGGEERTKSVVTDIKKNRLRWWEYIYGKNGK